MLYPAELRAHSAAWSSASSRFYLLAGSGWEGFWRRRRRRQGKGLDDVEASAAEELVDDGLGEAAGVVLDPHRLLHLVEVDLADAVDLAEAVDGHRGGFGGHRAVAVEDVELGHGSMVAEEIAGEARGLLGAEGAEIADDLGVGPVLGGDEFSAEDASFVDDIALWDLFGAVEGGDARGGIAQGEEVDVVSLEEAVVLVGVLVLADGDDGDLGEAALEFEQAGKLFDAGGAPGGPEVENDDVAAKLGEIEGVGSVGEGELWSWSADASGVAAAIAPGGGEEAKA